MSESHEAHAQLARLLGDASLAGASLDALQRAAEDGFDRLVGGLLAETAASDDVFDRESALAFLEMRLDFLDGVLDAAIRTRLREALAGRVAAW